MHIAQSQAAGSTGCHLVEANRGSALLKRSGTGSVLSPRGDEAPSDSGVLVTDLSMQPVRQGVDLDVILGRDSELCDLGRGRIVRISRAMYSYPGQSGPPPAAASRCIAGAGSPASANTLRSRKPIYRSSPARR